MEEKKDLSRRGFITGSAAAVGAGALAVGLAGCAPAASASGSAASGTSASPAKPTKIIGTEEHWYPEFFFKEPGSPGFETMQSADRALGGISELIGDVGDARIARMKQYGLDMQVLSLGGSSVDSLPAAQQIAYLSESNDMLVDAIAANPSYFAGFIAIPASIPDAAVAEIERCSTMKGMVGVSVLSNINGTFLDQAQYAPVLEICESLELPIYIHPTYAIPTIRDIFYDVGIPTATTQFSQAAIGWHYETAVHVLRMVFSGVFDRYPKLQVAIGHLGEGIPFFIDRLGSTTNTMIERGGIPLQKKIPDYLKENVHYTLGAFNWANPFNLLKSQMGVERIMFSTDYPFSPGTGQDAIDVAVKFLQTVTLTADERNKIAYQNATALFKL